MGVSGGGGREEEEEEEGIEEKAMLNSEVRLISHACALRPHICRRRR